MSSLVATRQKSGTPLEATRKVPMPSGFAPEVAVGSGGGGATPPSGTIDDVTHRILAGATAAVAAFLTAMTIGYVVYAFDSTNQNGVGFTIGLALVVFGTPAIAAWWFASKLWNARRRD